MRRKHNLNLETANQRQHFSIRKLTVGAASILFGTTFLFGAGQTVQADSVNGVTNGELASAEVKNTEEEQIQSNEASSEVKDDQQKDASATDQSAKTVVQNEDKENSSEVDKTKSTQEAADKVETDADKAVKDVQKNDSTQESKDQQDKIKTTTLKLDKDEKAVNRDTLKESKVATANTNKKQATDTQKDPDEIHVTANFVNHNTGEVIKAVELTAKDGQTLYDALGTDVYDYILQDYPSYVRLSSEDYEAKVNYHGYNDYDHMFNDPKLAEEFTKWQKEFKAG